MLALQIDHVRAERDVLAEVHNPYVVKLYYSFQARVLLQCVHFLPCHFVSCHFNDCLVSPDVF